ncbi:sulfotransferase [Paracoccus sp. Z118]|uniref:sulfotransferase family protein n=1 Tax=Paracoccus sp. Z118 TaxID=2851017 RepID=UPI001C2BF045|nr:sulfotransferase [Paracoccus sp. Z118]MBV0891626.1 sulfotransferase [Paracoccus sp. Z118]
MHRSGTSALTGALAQMGCDMPRHLMAPEEMNPKGFFESDAVTGLNEQLLASAGQTWFSFPPFPHDWYRSAAAIEFAERAVETLRAEYGDSPLFAMKDPRICRLVPFWDAALRRAGCTPLYVCTHRHPLDVASSMQHWAGYDMDYALLLWLRHVLDAEADSRGKPRVFVSYELLLADWQATIARIAATLNLDWPRSPDAAVEDMEELLSSKFRNFAVKGEDAATAKRLPEWVREVYAIVERWAGQGEDAADFPRLDEIRAQFDAMTPTMAGMVASFQSGAVERRQQGERIGRLETRLVEQAAGHAGQMQAAHEQIARLTSAQRQREQEVADRTREAAEANAALAALQVGADRLRRDHEALGQLHRRDSRQLDQMTQRIAAQMLREVDARLDAAAHEPEAPAPKGPSAEERVGLLERQLAELQQHSSGLENTVRELTSSTSWAVTRPFRWVSGRFRRR